MAKHFDPEIGRATRWKKGQPSPNPSGRRSCVVISEALRAKLAEVKEGDPQRRTYAEILAASLVETACSRGSSSVAAANQILDRLEGRARQQIEVASITRELRDRSDEDLQYFLDHDHWPEEERSEPGALTN